MILTNGCCRMCGRSEVDMTTQELMKQAPAGATLVQQYKNGNIKIAYECTCSRCGNGDGVYYIGVCNNRLIPSHVANGVCFKCGGTGKERATMIIMTPENRAKADADRAKREAKAAAEQAKREAEIAAQKQREAEEQAKREAEIAAAKAVSQYVGNVGDRVELTLTLAYTARWEVRSFYGGTDTMQMHILKDADGNTFTWKTQNGLCVALGNDQYKVAEKGDTVKIKGTIKDHSEYKDEKQTVLTRCKVVDIIEA